MADKILNQSQAEAVYSAMCHLNNVGGRLEHVTMQHPTDRKESMTVVQRFDGCVDVWQSCQGQRHSSTIERHANQSAFAAAYGLPQG